MTSASLVAVSLAATLEPLEAVGILLYVVATALLLRLRGPMGPRRGRAAGRDGRVDDPSARPDIP